MDAADWLRSELGVSKPLWGEACLAMGREEAAIAVAIVSAKPADHFRSSPGGYFHGMVAKAKAGDRLLEAAAAPAEPENRLADALERLGNRCGIEIAGLTPTEKVRGEQRCGS